jgi:hypothetical protein
MRTIEGDGTATEIVIDVQDDIRACGDRHGLTFNGLVYSFDGVSFSRIRHGVPVAATAFNTDPNYTLTCTVEGYKVTVSFDPALPNGYIGDFAFHLFFPGE